MPPGKLPLRIHHLLFPDVQVADSSVMPQIDHLGKGFSSKLHNRFEFFQRED